MNWPEPNIGAGHKLGIFPASFLARGVGCAIWSKHVVMYQAYCGFLDKEIMIPTFRPGATIIDASARRGRKHSYPIDLQIRLACRVNQGRNFLMIGHYGRGAHAVNASSSQEFFGHDHVEGVLATSRRAVKHFAIIAKVESPRVA